MAGTKMGVVGCGGRMGRMLVAEIAASEGCTLAGGCAKAGSGYINQDIGGRENAVRAFAIGGPPRRCPEVTRAARP